MSRENKSWRVVTVRPVLLFIHTIELVVRTLLNYNLIAKYAGEDLKETSKLEYVKSYWSTITKHIFHSFKRHFTIENITDMYKCKCQFFH